MLLLPARAEADRLPSAELDRLAAGLVVSKPLDIEVRDADYFGGVSYVLIKAPMDDVITTLLDIRTYTKIFPLTLEARLEGYQGKDQLIYFKVGGKAGTAAYTLVVRRESPGLFRFWMDQSRPHDVADCWGYFRVVPHGAGSTLLTYAALLHLDFGVVKMLFKEKIRYYSMRTAALVRNYVEHHPPAERTRALPGTRPPG